MSRRNVWLVKSEEDAYPLEELEREGTTPWTGIRNYEARNLMRDRMKPGDPVLFYHSRADVPGVVGLAEVASEPYPDPTQFDEKSPYHDPKASHEDPRWWLVDISFVSRFQERVPLAEIKAHPDLRKMVLVKRSRLSVQPVSRREFETVKELGSGG